MIGIPPFIFTGASRNAALLLVAQLVQGFGLGASLLPITTIAFASLTKAEIPRASAAFSIVQRAGAPFGVTVVAVLLQGYLASPATSGTPIPDAFHATFWWVIASSAIPFALAFFLPSLRPSGHPGQAVLPTNESASESVSAICD